MKNNTGIFGDWKIPGKLGHPLHPKDRKVSFSLPWAREVYKYSSYLWRLHPFLFRSPSLEGSTNLIQRFKISLSPSFRAAPSLSLHVPGRQESALLATCCPQLFLSWSFPFLMTHFIPLPNFPSTSVFFVLGEPPSLVPPLGHGGRKASLNSACLLFMLFGPSLCASWVSGTESFWGFLSIPSPPLKRPPFVDTISNPLFYRSFLDKLLEACLKTQVVWSLLSLLAQQAPSWQQVTLPLSQNVFPCLGTLWLAW